MNGRKTIPVSRLHWDMLKSMTASEPYALVS